MKKLIIFCLVAFLLLPSSAFADIWLTSPANRTWTTNRHPTFRFNYDTTDPNDWFIVEIANNPGVGTEGNFYSENIVALSGILDYPIKAWRDEYPLDTGYYFWHALQYSYEDMTFYASSTYRITVFKWVANRHHKKVCRKNKRYHRKKCKRIRFHKKYCRKRQV